jgi:hypothetical protein
VGLVVSVLLLAVALGGCFLRPFWMGRPDSDALSGPAVYAENCAGCHRDGGGQPYTAGVHTSRGIRCGQCHAGGNHPDFTEPVRDSKCGGCHQPEFQQTLLSKHFATRVRHGLDSDRPARVALRRDGFAVGVPGEGKFVGDVVSGELGGRLCAACHYDGHRFGLRTVQRVEFCVSCHAKRDDHFPMEGTANRCLTCHVRVGETVTGQVVNTHRFTIPGGGQ